MSDIRDLLSPYRELLHEVDTWFRRCSLAVGEQIACQRGCSACCRGLFDITLLDAYLLKDGFEHLPGAIRERPRQLAQQRLEAIRRSWPDFTAPYLLNGYPEEQWDELMPDDDETPCPLLGEGGNCLIYDSRPMTCRLHGIPLVDDSGEVLFDEWCTLNFSGGDPLGLEALRAPFNDIFSHELLLFREFTKRLLGQSFNELDTLIPAALFLDFDHFNLPEPLWSRSCS
jgi:Fe-S-cluster containining protein